MPYVVRGPDGAAIPLARGGRVSIGRHAGPHNGTLLIEQAIDWLVTNRLGTVIVQSTGNYYSRAVHMEGWLRETRTAVLPFNVPARGGQPAMVEFWYNAPDTFSARARASILRAPTAGSSNRTIARG